MGVIMAIVEFKGVSRVYTSGDHVLKALDDVNMSLERVNLSSFSDRAERVNPLFST